MNITKPFLSWPDPEESHLKDPRFEKIWGVIKHWDINVPQAYDGYCGATGNHVRAILDGLDGKTLKSHQGSTQDIFTFMIDNSINAIDNISSMEMWKKQLEGKEGPIEFGEYIFYIVRHAESNKISVSRLPIYTKE